MYRTRTLLIQIK
jgi:hypothetical protein